MYYGETVLVEFYLGILISERNTEQVKLNAARDPTSLFYLNNTTLLYFIGKNRYFVFLFCGKFKLEPSHLVLQIHGYSKQHAECRNYALFFCKFLKGLFFWAMIKQWWIQYKFNLKRIKTVFLFVLAEKCFSITKPENNKTGLFKFFKYIFLL